LDPIGDDIGCPWNDKLAGTRNAPGAADLGIDGEQLLDVLYQVQHHPPRGGRIVFRNANSSIRRMISGTEI
jgi:hypothetical protein